MSLPGIKDIFDKDRAPSSVAFNKLVDKIEAEQTNTNYSRESIDDFLRYGTPLNVQVQSHTHDTTLLDKSEKLFIGKIHVAIYIAGQEIGLNAHKDFDEDTLY